MHHAGVFYLVWAPYGHHPLEEFIRSYLQNPAGLPHDLIIIYNGFNSEAEISPYEERLKSIAHGTLYIQRPGFDLESYFTAAGAFDHEQLCFLNTRSRILVGDWLLRMSPYAQQQDIGIVGCTGSYESLYSGFLNFQGASHGETVFDRFTRRDGSLFRKVATAAQINRWKRFWYFPPFPNPHVRTNGFMITRDTLSRLKWKKEMSRLDTLRLESGRRSITRRLLEWNLRAVVVGKDGRAFDVDNWRSSGTFRQGEQENLLIADNRTDEYLFADAGGRRILSILAWGEKF